MLSPFPGMDPYLEMYWGDVHTSIAIYSRDQLQPLLPGDLRIHVEEHVSVEFPPEGNTQRSLRIVDRRSGNRIVTAIELLSPANKVREGNRKAYRRRQEELLAGGANLVEIDLIRAGQYVLAAPAHRLPATQQTRYHICVVRAWRPKDAEVYPASLREPLPTFRVPLRETDPDVALNLQEVLNKSYANGGYEGYIDYRVDPQPSLQGEDAAWADQLLREKGLR